MTATVTWRALEDREIVALGEIGFFMRDGWLSAPLARRMRAEIDALARAGRLHPAGMSRGASHHVDARERGDETAWLEPSEAPPALAALCDRFETLRRALNCEAYLGLDRLEVQVARYAGTGERYRRHRDAFADRPSRRVTAIYYANPGWCKGNGGLLRLHVGAAPLDLAPANDRLVVFLSERVEHEVTPAWAPRVAVTAWYYGASAPR